MKENTSEFSTRSFKQLIKSETNKRVSDGSAIALAEEIEEKADLIAFTAQGIAQKDGRKTIRQEDMRKAILEHSETEIKDSSLKVIA